MNGDALAAIATALSAVLVVASLLLVWIQIRDLRKGVASSTYQTIVKMFDDYASQLIANPDIRGRLADAGKPLDPKVDEAVHWLLAIRFDWYESIVIQAKRYRVIPQDILEHWMHVLAMELDHPLFQQYWESNGRWYHPLLRLEIERLRPGAGEASQALP